MPAFLLPRKSGAHRIAAIALYRALISTCRAASVSSEQREALRNVVRSRFRHNVHISSKRLLTHAFEAGHEALDHLHFSAHGKAESTSYLLSVLSLVPSWLKESPMPRPVRPKTMSRLASGFENSALARPPLPQSALKGRKRVVPILVSANRIPFLRYQDPQPPALSHYIKARIVNYQKLQDRRWQLAEMLELARREDSWDQGIEEALAAAETAQSDIEHADTQGSSEDEPEWQTAIRIALDATYEALNRDLEKNQMWATKMVEIVDRETELAEKERKDRQMVKNKMRREGKQAGDKPMVRVVTIPIEGQQPGGAVTP